MTGLSDGAVRPLILDMLSLNGDAEIVQSVVDGKDVYSTKGGFYRLLKLTEAKKNEKPEEVNLGEKVTVVFLKIRRALQQRSSDGKLVLWTSEHTSPDDIVELHRAGDSRQVEIGTARALREKYDGLRTIQYVYGLLLGHDDVPQLVKIRFKGSALGSEVKAEGVPTFYDYIYAEHKDASGKKEHLRHYETLLSCVKEQGKKTYYTVVFERGDRLKDELCAVADAELRKVHDKIVAVDEARAKRIESIKNKGGDIGVPVAVDDSVVAGDDAPPPDDINPDDIPF